jgi:hypothetical protein
MDTVRCCCCGEVRPFEEVADCWFPLVFHDDEELGTLCDECASFVGLRDARDGEVSHNDRVLDWEEFCRRRNRFARKGKK